MMVYIPLTGFIFLGNGQVKKYVILVYRYLQIGKRPNEKAHSLQLCRCFQSAITSRELGNVDGCETCSVVIDLRLVALTLRHRVACRYRHIHLHASLVQLKLRTLQETLRSGSITHR